MALGIALLLAVAMGVFVMTPLLAPERAAEGVLPVDVTPLADLKRRRMVVYENLQDLEFEYKAGKIAPEDYDGLKESYRTEAAQLMAASQQVETLSAAEALIEREVAARRAQRQGQQAPQYVCSQCGFENPLPVKFCGECGAPLASPARDKRPRSGSA
jgi:rubrerythrin